MRLMLPDYVRPRRYMECSLDLFRARGISAARSETRQMSWHRALVGSVTVGSAQRWKVKSWGLLEDGGWRMEKGRSVSVRENDKKTAYLVILLEKLEYTSRAASTVE